MRRNLPSGMRFITNFAMKCAATKSATANRGLSSKAIPTFIKE